MRRRRSSRPGDGKRHRTPYRAPAVDDPAADVIPVVEMAVESAAEELVLAGAITAGTSGNSKWPSTVPD
jgi:hypothetical protein